MQYTELWRECLQQNLNDHILEKQVKTDIKIKLSPFMLMYNVSNILIYVHTFKLLTK